MGRLSRPGSPEEWARTQRPREMDANAKAVEILSRIRKWSERTAVITSLEFLSRGAAAERRGNPRLIGHASACDEIADFRARFPAHDEVTARYAC